ncbi:MAG TPA: polymer-forming cytoskeletal protein [Clostridia bacterium]|nr:polymer-forming cytoskeletal protein [Clostridia bacterium]
MFKRKKNRPPTTNSGDLESVDTIIGSGTSFDGKLAAKGTLRIDGKVDGEIAVEGNIYLGENSLINANISCKNLTVAGEVNGMVTLAGKLQIARTGKVIGDIDVGNLVISDGAIFKGNCKMANESGLEKGSGTD